MRPYADTGPVLQSNPLLARQQAMQGQMGGQLFGGGGGVGLQQLGLSGGGLGALLQQQQQGMLQTQAP
jgi:hypothetical protein